MDDLSNSAPSRRRRIPPSVIGAFVGIAVWALALLLFQTLDQFNSAFPKWVRDLDLVDGVGSICMVIVYPIAIGGWLLFWGDGKPPVGWVDNLALNYTVGIGIMVAAGAVVGHFAPRVIAGFQSRNR